MSTIQKSNSRFDRRENLKSEIHNTLVASQVFDKNIRMISDDEGIEM